MRTITVIAFVLLSASHGLAAETFSARVVGVVDGDTLRVSRKEGGTLKVRLHGIDCPEKARSTGKRPDNWRVGWHMAGLYVWNPEE